MKNTIAPFIVFYLLLAGSIFAQQEKGIIGEDNWLSYWTEFKAQNDIVPEPTQILTGNLKGDTVVLKKREIYLLLGDVFVTDSTTLLIEPGTLILADHKTKASLIVSPGSRIQAQGNQTDPIVFTSNRDVPKPGDWGGIFILGDAPLNKIMDRSRLDKGLVSTHPGALLYGGTNTQSYSGVLDYVRIEYAGKRTKDYGTFNALSLYGVGTETVVSNIMASYSLGNSFYVAGGHVDLSQLVSYKASRSDFNFDFGAQTHISNSLAVRSPYTTVASGAASLHATSHSVIKEADFAKAQTSVIAKNLTLLNLSKNLKSAIEVGLVHEAIFVDEKTSLSMDGSVISGFNPAVIFSKDIFLNDDNLQRIRFTKMYFNSCEGNIFIEDNTNNDDLEGWYGNSAFQNVYSKGADKETFIDPQNPRDPDFRLRINKIFASNRSN